MSTHDVPGANPNNGDALAMGCWGEHDDGSLIFVESTEVGRGIYSIFDMAKSPPIEYRDAMPEWLWHDKTPFPWDRVIKAGASDGGRMAFAEHQMNAAERVAESLKLRGAGVSRDLRYRGEQVVERSKGIWDKISRAVAELGK